MTAVILSNTIVKEFFKINGLTLLFFHPVYYISERLRQSVLQAYSPGGNKKLVNKVTAFLP